jgi:isopentenyldiphosphate isomerase
MALINHQDPDHELLDVLDETGAPTGEVKPRGDVHRDGDWHRCFHLWIVRDDSYVLVQRRSKYKQIEPNKIDTTVGGHFQAGETLNEVVREAYEEIGLEINVDRLSFLETRCMERHYPELIDREFQDIYVLREQQPLEHYLPHKIELTALYEAPLSRLIALYETGSSLPVAGWDGYGRPNDALLTQDDVIPHDRTYMATTLGKVQAWLDMQLTLEAKGVL